MDGFDRITGFAEGHDIHVRLRMRVGHLDPVAPLEGPQLVRTIRGDARRLHLSPEHAGALVQVASQFNLPKMVGPSMSPDDGVTRYLHDPNQGPACAIAAGPGRSTGTTSCRSTAASSRPVVVRSTR